jgi:hypothetical protein
MERMCKDESLRFLKQGQWKSALKDQEEALITTEAEEEALAVVQGTAEVSAVQEEDSN